METINLKLSPNDLEGVVQKAATSAVEDAIGSYEVRAELEKAIGNGFADSAIGPALERAISAIDAERIAQVVALDFADAVGKILSVVLQDATVNLVAKMRGMSEYGVEADAKRAALRRELFPGKEGPAPDAAGATPHPEPEYLDLDDVVREEG